MEERGGRTFLYLSVAAANLVALTTGMMLAWTSPVVPKLRQIGDDNPLSEPITSEEDSWIGSLLALGAAFGPFPFAFLADRIGRKLTLVAVGLPFLASCLMCAFAQQVILICIGRFIAGLGVGGLFAVLPMYIAEVSEISVRGMLGVSINNFLSFGLLLSYVVGPYISVTWFSIMCAIFPAVFIVVFFLFMKETPYYLCGKNKHDEAANSLAFLRSRSVNDAVVQKELELIKNLVDKDQSQAGTIMDIFKAKSSIKALIISMMLAIFQQLAGINVVLFNAQTIFYAAGTALDETIPPMIIGAVQLLTSFVTPIAVDRMGRKILLVISAFGMLISEVPLGAYFYLKDAGQNVDAINWLPILTLVLFIITYNLGFGPLPWTVMAEIVPGNIKSVVNSLTASSCWFVSFLLVQFFNSIADEIGMGVTFWILSAICLLAGIFTLFVVPETKGKSFSEIQEILNS